MKLIRYKRLLRNLYNKILLCKFAKAVREKLNLQTVPIFNPDFHTFVAAGRHRSFDSMSAILAWLLNEVKKEYPDFSLRGKTALEIGTGKFLVHALGMYVLGCKKVVSVDKYRQLDAYAMKAAMKNSILARRFLSEHAPIGDVMKNMKSLEETRYKLSSFQDLGVEYHAPFDLLVENKYDGSIDFIMSYTVLEHVPVRDTDDLLASIVRTLKPGGICVHFVDLEDHINPIYDPFAFLAEDREWKDIDGFNRGNRMRFSGWMDAINKFDDMVWSVSYIAVRDDVSLPDKVSGFINYKDKDDLRVGGFVLIGKKQMI